MYEKRHKRIEERKAVLLVKEQQEKQTEAAETEETQVTAEAQPEALPQPEETAA